VTKFVGKFRKNQDYNEDYSYMPKRKHRNEHSEIKKLKSRNVEELLSELEDVSLPEKTQQHR
jgi:hypothetical protein